jgi:hypothetical protein
MNADTLDGKHADDFVLASKFDEIVGDTPVSEQINSAIPLVTTDDNGKFMTVVNGVWAAESIPNAEEGVF